MSEPKIVDAVPSVPANSGVNVAQQKIPVKVDGAALANMMSKIASAQQASVEYVSPAEYIAATGARMKDMYERYENLRKLGGLFNGKSFNDPIPQNVQIDNITITYRLADQSAPVEAKILNVACVGDIAQLLSTEMGTIILSLQQEAANLTKLSKATEDTAQKARTAWENSNKDRKIVMTNTVDTNTGDITTVPADSEVSLTNENQGV